MIDKKLAERFNLINQFFIKHKRAPTYSEMLSLFGLKSKNAVFKIVSNLQKAGLIEKDSKGYVILKNPKTMKLLGSVEAGFPSPAQEELLDKISLDEFLIKNPTSTFILEVSGDSMIEAGILPKDYVLVDKSIVPQDGDIVIACVDGDWTMKYLKKQNGNYILIPANPKYKPIIPKNELTIAGVVVSVIRKYK
jgi:repressor LexA